MAKIRIRQFTHLPPPLIEGQLAGSDLVTLPVFSDPRDPLHAEIHQMPSGWAMQWHGSKNGTILYVWSGQIAVGGRSLSRGSTIIIEHRTNDTVKLVAIERSEILAFSANPEMHFHQPKAGGHIHLLPAEDAPHTPVVNAQLNVGATLFADSECETCDLWLHANDFHNPNATIPLHRHSEDEIIVVTGGEIVLGGRSYGPGTAIAIASNTIYGFGTGPTGTSFINFRAQRPTFGFPEQVELADERGYYASMPSPPYANL